MKYQDMTNKLKFVNCIVCLRELKLIEFGFTDIYATEFKTHGHYGSSVIDSMDETEELRIVICDKCLSERSNAVYEIFGHKLRTANETWTKRQKQLVSLYDEVKYKNLAQHLSVNRETGEIDKFLPEDLFPDGGYFEKEILEKVYGENWKNYFIATVGEVMTYFVGHDITP